MEKLGELLEGIQNAEQVLEDAKDKMMAYIKPIILAHAGKDRVWGYYHECYTSREHVSITLRDNASGGPYDRTYHIPRAVFAATDATVAARAIREADEAFKASCEREADERAFEALRQKLGK